MVQAETEQSARAQLERRGFHKVELTPAEGAASTAPPPPVPSMGPAATVAPALARVQEPHWLRQLDWGRLVPLATAAGAVLVLGLFVLSWIMRDKTYTLRVEGELRLQTRRKLEAGYWKRVHVNLWLPESKLTVHSDGTIWKRESAKSWQKQKQTARYECTISPEGRYVMEVSLPLSQLPSKCGVVAHAPGFRPRAKQNIALVMKDDKLQAQSTSLLLQPRRRKADGKKKPRPGRPSQAATPASSAESSP